MAAVEGKTPKGKGKGTYSVETEVKIEGGIVIEDEAENGKGKGKGKEDGRVPNTLRSTEYAHQNRSPPLLAWPRREG